MKMHLLTLTNLESFYDSRHLFIQNFVGKGKRRTQGNLHPLYPFLLRWNINNMSLLLVTDRVGKDRRDLNRESFPFSVFVLGLIQLFITFNIVCASNQ